MNTRDFCFWLQGYFEVHRLSNSPTTGLTDEQIACIKKHLDMVFVHDIDPSMGDDKQQKLLNEIHDKTGPWEPSKYVKSEPWNDQYGKGAKPRC